MTMEWILKLLMGGWLPQGKRTQWTAFAVAVGAVATAVVQWGSGEMSFTQLMTLLADKWAVFYASYTAYFIAEKVDALKDLANKTFK